MSQQYKWIRASFSEQSLLGPLAAGLLSLKVSVVKSLESGRKDFPIVLE